MANRRIANHSNSTNAAETPVEESRGNLRHLVDFLVCLGIWVVVVRGFAVEGYLISTGSMAPHLLGYHKRVVCPACQYPFTIGWSLEPSSSHASLATCPNCGQTAIDISQVPVNSGDQLLVHKNAFLLHPPRRWDVVVFRNPERPTQAYVKRVVGLPGEQIQIVDGDVFIDGQIQRKNLVQQEATRISVFDNDYAPQNDPTWRSRWVAGPGWTPCDHGFETTELPAADQQNEEPFQWLTYRHWTRSDGLTPITDWNSRIRTGSQNEAIPTRDIMLECHLSVGRGAGQLLVRMISGAHVCDCLFGFESGTMCLLIDGKRCAECRIPWKSKTDASSLKLEMSTIDRQVLVAIDGNQVLASALTDAEPSRDGDDVSSKRIHDVRSCPIHIGAWKMSVRVQALQVFRDVYYTHDRVLRAVEEPFSLGPDEFFFLGDNSPISLDSRRWSDPRVTSSMIVGKPFLLHLPSRPGRIQVGGRASYIRIPDFSRIRYIH